jgi:tRNA(adenine34) deaminase
MPYKGRKKRVINKKKFALTCNILHSSHFIFLFFTIFANNMTKTEEQNQKDEFYMRRALDEAHAALEAGEIPIGAVVVCRDRIIARAHNLTETLTDVTAHAEMQAITMAANQLGGKYLTECTLYVTVEPCVMCAGALGWAQVPRIVYGAPDKKRGYQLYAPKAFHPKAKIIGGILEEECRQLMVEFFKQLRVKN